MKIKKEASIAVIIGLILAIIVAGGVIRARKALETLSLPLKENLKKHSDTPNNSLVQDIFLELTTTDNSITTEPKIVLTGKTLSNTYIAILGEKSEYLIVPNDLGIFSQEVTLIKGANTIRITIYQADGKKLEKTLNAVYTTAQL